MLYAILCYDQEEVLGAWSKEQDDATKTRLTQVEKALAEQGRLGPVVRLLPTTAATTVRNSREALVLEGPFAETKEQLLGFFMIECKDLEEAIATAKDLAKANPGMGAYEIRPVALFKPGSSLP